MIYIDTSCLLKLVRIEAQSAAVGESVSNESEVLVSELALLEATVELKARRMAGEYSRARQRQLASKLRSLTSMEPFRPGGLTRGIWDTALRQDSQSTDVYCRTLDRLHLAAMELLGVTRLMTHDKAQAKAAEGLKFTVVWP